MKELIEQIKTTDFNQYKEALSKIRDLLDKGDANKIEEKDFLFLLRPYFWFVHNPGFQDIINTCEDALALMLINKKTIEEKTISLVGDEFFALCTFLATYLDEGKFNPSGWKMLFASPEIASSLIADKFADKFEELKRSEEEIQKLRKLGSLMKDIEGCKHLTYWCLRRIGADFTHLLEKVIYAFPVDDQTFILHALDAFPGNPDVILFYKNFIDRTQSNHLKEVAQKYLKNVNE